MPRKPIHGMIALWFQPRKLDFMNWTRSSTVRRISRPAISHSPWPRNQKSKRARATLLDLNSSILRKLKNERLCAVKCLETVFFNCKPIVYRLVTHIAERVCCKIEGKRFFPLSQKIYPSDDIWQGRSGRHEISIREFQAYLPLSASASEYPTEETNPQTLRLRPS